MKRLITILITLITVLNIYGQDQTVLSLPQRTTPASNDATYWTSSGGTDYHIRWATMYDDVYDNYVSRLSIASSFDTSYYFIVNKDTNAVKISYGALLDSIRVDALSEYLTAIETRGEISDSLANFTTDTANFAKNVDSAQNNFIVNGFIKGRRYDSNYVTVGEYGDYTSIKDALDYADNKSSQTNPYVVYVTPGVYVENPMIIPDGAQLRLINSTVVASDNNNPLFTMGKYTEIYGGRLIGATNAPSIYTDSINAIIKNLQVNGSACGIHAGINGSMIVRDVTLINCGIGLHAEGDISFTDILSIGSDTTIYADGGDILGATLATQDVGDLAILQSSGSSTIVITNGLFRDDQIEVVDWSTISLTYNSLRTGDVAFKTSSEFNVGKPELGSETVLGQGDSYIRGLKVYTYNPSSNVYTDRSLNASNLDSVFSFDGTTTDNMIYIGSSLRDTNYLRHYGIKLNIFDSLLIGSGSVVWEYYNGSGWVEFHYCISNSNAPYFTFAEDLSDKEGSYQICYDMAMTNNNWGYIDSVGLGYGLHWTRLRITSPITKSWEIKQIKLHPSRMEFNDDGYKTAYGNSRTIKKLPWNIDQAKPASASPGNKDVYLSDNLDAGKEENDFANGATDRICLVTKSAFDMCTSTDLRIEWSVVSTAGGGDIDWVVRFGYSSSDSAVYTSSAAAPSTAPTETSYIPSDVVAPSAANIQKDYSVNVDVSKIVPRRADGFGDLIWLSIERISGDTHAGDIAIISLDAYYLSWLDGGYYIYE